MCGDHSPHCCGHLAPSSPHGAASIYYLLSCIYSLVLGCSVAPGNLAMMPCFVHNRSHSSYRDRGVKVRPVILLQITDIGTIKCYLHLLHVKQYLHRLVAMFFLTIVALKSWECTLKRTTLSLYIQSTSCYAPVCVCVENLNSVFPGITVLLYSPYLLSLL